jgi:hypothetical protein
VIRGLDLFGLTIIGWKIMISKGWLRRLGEGWIDKGG